jgi:hypothetical protein
MPAADIPALAAAAAKLPGWKWRAGMRAALIDDGRRVWSGVLDGTYHVAADAIPVLSDPATGGWMLALLCAPGCTATVEFHTNQFHATVLSEGGYLWHKGSGASLGEACARVALQIGRWA